MHMPRLLMAIGRGQAVTFVYFTIKEIALRRASTLDTIVHPDHGPHSTVWVFNPKVFDHGVRTSLATVGEGCDNTLIKSFSERMTTG